MNTNICIHRTNVGPVPYFGGPLRPIPRRPSTPFDALAMQSITLADNTKHAYLNFEFFGWTWFKMACNRYSQFLSENNCDRDCVDQSTAINQLQSTASLISSHNRKRLQWIGIIFPLFPLHLKPSVNVSMKIKLSHVWNNRRQRRKLRAILLSRILEKSML